MNCDIRKGTFQGWEAVFLENEFVQLVAVPVIGGRIMAYDLGPYSLFFVDPEHAGKLYSAEENQGDGSLAAWKNYGGDKTWPAPQGWDNDEQWHGPPDPILDTGHYTIDLYASDSSHAIIRMISPPDFRTGVQITRQFTIYEGSSRVGVDLSFTNIKDEPITWSIWDVVQLQAEKQNVDGSKTFDSNCVVTAPINENSCFPNGFNIMFGKPDNPQWQIDQIMNLFNATYLWEIGKVGLDSQDGWIGFHNGTEGISFTEKFEVDPHATYPDDGATIECWTVGAGQVENLDFSGSDIYLMETEVLAPLCKIAPGETTNFKIEWGVARCIGPVLDVQAGGCSGKKLETTISNNYLQLNGQFGVFDAGQLVARFYDRQNDIIAEQTLGSVDPFTAITIDRLLPLPNNPKRIDLVVIANADKAERLLATTQVE